MSLTNLRHYTHTHRLLRRLATLLSQQASLMASNEAFKKQAEGASTAAKKYMDENELLQEVIHTHTHTAGFRAGLNQFCMP